MPTLLSIPVIARRCGYTRQRMWQIDQEDGIPAVRITYPGSKQPRFEDSPKLLAWCEAQKAKRQRRARRYTPEEAGAWVIANRELRRRRMSNGFESWDALRPRWRQLRRQIGEAWLEWDANLIEEALDDIDALLTPIANFARTLKERLEDLRRAESDHLA
jgi:predicted RNA-binding Zn ribbon-like protein